MGSERPRLRDLFWDGDRRAEGKQPNGRIIEINWEYPRSVIVRFEDGGEVESYEWEDIQDGWCDLFGGCYMVGQPISFNSKGIPC